MERNSGSKPPNQRRMGPAPFASFEDLSDEMESPSDEKDVTSSIIRLPGITEQDSNVTSPVDPKNRCPTMGISLIGSTARNVSSSTQNSATHSPLLNRVKPSITPRIDISRASSSSHQDSRDSTPDREMCDSNEENNVKLGLGFKEDGALELRLSTEELDFQENVENKKNIIRNQTPSPEPEEQYGNNRKDSQCSDVILLSISGRTSRLSSIGSQGSAKSRFSNASHFSITSGHSAYSQCSSPHKTILETSFCGYKPDSQATLDKDEIKEDSEELEKVLLSRKSNLTEVVLVEGLKKIISRDKSPGQVSSKYSQGINYNEITENYNEKNNEKCTIPKKIVSKSGVEYIYIPLKGPLPTDDNDEKNAQKAASHSKTGEQCIKRSNGNIGQNHDKKNLTKREPRHKSSPINAAEYNSAEPKYIRIKLKPDHCYDDDGNESTHNISKPTCLNLSLANDNDSSSKLQIENQITSVREQKQTRSLTNTPSVSPKLARKNSKGGSTPSPSVPRRNSLASMFRTGPDSPSSLKKKRKNTLTNIIKNTNTSNKGRSKSIDKNKSLFFPATSSTESVDSKGKANSILSIFKTSSSKEKGKSKDNSSSQDSTPKLKINDGIRCKKTVDRNHESPLNSQSIRIPLHSPTYYTNKSLFQELSQEPEVTIIKGSIQSNINILVSSEPLESNTNLEDQEIDKVVNESVNTNEAKNNNYKQKQLENENEITHEIQNKSSSSLSDSTKEICLENKETRKVPSRASDNSLKHSQDKLSKNSNNEVYKISLDEDASQSSLIDKKSEVDKHNNGMDDDHNSSESERDLEIDYSKSNKRPDLKMTLDSLEIERKAIFLQQDSFEDELPYIPTTLPLERSAGIPILPIKQRCVLDVKTCPIERPRSTTPIHSSGLENYIDGFMGKSEIKENKVTKLPEKLKISLPRPESTNKTKNQAVTTTCSSSEYAKSKEETPPPLPPKGVQKTWINFEEVPERRKPPKRIQTIPSRGHIDISGLVLKDHVVYTYVNPEECKCECHEHKEQDTDTIKNNTQEEELPLLDLENQESNPDR